MAVHTHSPTPVKTETHDKMLDRISRNTYKQARKVLLSANEPFDRIAHPRGKPGFKRWCILRDPVVKYGSLKTINPLVWTAIPCERNESDEPILYLRRGDILVPVLLSVLWHTILTEKQKTILWLSISGQKDRCALVLAEDDTEATTSDTPSPIHLSIESSQKTPIGA